MFKYLLSLLFILPSFSPDQTVLYERLLTYRESQGRSKTIVMSRLLCDRAQNHAESMARRDRLTHNGFNERMRGYTFGAENVAYGRSVDDVMRMWRNSRGHRNNMLSDCKEIGIGQSDGYWCLILCR